MWLTVESTSATSFLFAPVSVADEMIDIETQSTQILISRCIDANADQALRFHLEKWVRARLKKVLRLIVLKIKRAKITILRAGGWKLRVGNDFFS